MRDHHDLTWFKDEADRIRDIARATFGVELTDYERKEIRDTIYRVVNDAKVRANSVGIRG